MSQSLSGVAYFVKFSFGTAFFRSSETHNWKMTLSDGHVRKYPGWRDNDSRETETGRVFEAVRKCERQIGRFQHKPTNTKED